MIKWSAVGISLLLFAVTLGIVAASPSQHTEHALSVERSEDRMSATATWDPNHGAESQAFFVVAKLLLGEEDVTGFGVVADTFRYVDYPLDGDVGTLSITNLDPARAYIYGVSSIAKDSNGAWLGWSPWQTFDESESNNSVDTDRAALVALYNATDGANWRKNDNWLSDEPMGEWSGVETDADGRVVSLNLWLNNLDGELPPEIGDLAKLERLNLSFNRLQEALPAEVGNLASLKELRLFGNQLSGEIPPSLGGLLNLQKLYMSVGNQFSGCIPNSLKNVAENDLGDLELPFCS